MLYDPDLEEARDQTIGNWIVGASLAISLMAIISFLLLVIYA